MRTGPTSNSLGETHEPDWTLSRAPVFEIIYFDAGGGHRNARDVLTERLQARYPGCTVRHLHLRDLLRSFDPVTKLDGLREKLDRHPALQEAVEKYAPTMILDMLQVENSEDFYNRLLKQGRTEHMNIQLRLLQLFVRIRSSAMQEILAAHFAASPAPDIRISVIPNFLGPLQAASYMAQPHVPFTTVMTDMADCPPDFWMKKSKDGQPIIICPTRRAVAQAEGTGFYKPHDIYRTSGGLLRQCFYESPGPDDPTLDSLRLSALPATKTILIMFGGYGSLTAQRLVAELNNSTLDVQYIVMCGHNEKLRYSLQDTPRCAAVGFTQNVAPYMRLCQLALGKPGPNFIWESLHMGLPIIVEGGTGVMPQERPNIDLLIENGLGFATDFSDNIAPAVARMIDDLEIYRRNIAKLGENHSAFEAAEIIGSIAVRAATDETLPAPHSIRRFFTKTGTR